MLVPAEYVATLRATYKAGSDAEAELAAHRMAELIREEILDDEEDDDIYVTQVISTEPAVIAEEIISVLARARDTLIRTKLSHCVDVAREVDKVCFALEQGDLESLVPYDYGRFFDRLEEVLKRANSSK